jgi:hypothetical protein
MFGTQWWCWFAKWTRFGEIQNWYDLVCFKVATLLSQNKNLKKNQQGWSTPFGSP